MFQENQELNDLNNQIAQAKEMKDSRRLIDLSLQWATVLARAIIQDDWEFHEGRPDYFFDAEHAQGHILNLERLYEAVQRALKAVQNHKDQMQAMLETQKEFPNDIDKIEEALADVVFHQETEAGMADFHKAYGEQK